MNFFQVYNLTSNFLCKLKPTYGKSFRAVGYIFDNNLFNKYPFLKLIFGIIIINLMYRTFLYFLFLMIKSVFPIIYMYFMLYFMDKQSDDKPITNLIKKIKKDNLPNPNNEDLINTLENELDNENSKFTEEV